MPRIIYIAGYGRSGSALLQALLGNMPGVVSMSELHKIWSIFQGWRPGFESPKLRDQWNLLQRRHTELLPGGDFGGVRRLQNRAEFFFTPFFMFSTRRQMAVYGAALKALFRAIAETIQGDVIVDISKTTWTTAWRPLALYRHVSRDIAFIHLVRDGRAVAWSNIKRIAPERRNVFSTSGMAAWSAIGWIAANGVMLIQRCFLPRDRVIRVYYEVLLANPVEELRNLCDFLDVSPHKVIDRLQNSEKLVGVARFEKGIQLEPDDEWKNALPIHARLIYWILCWPLHLLFKRRLRIED